MNLNGSRIRLAAHGSRRAAVALGLLLACGALIGCGSGGNRDAGGSDADEANRRAARTIRAEMAAPDVNIVLFLVDTLRFDRLNAYGYKNPHTPHIDSIAASSVIFDQAYSAAPWTLPSVASLHTSTHLCEHGVTFDGQQIPTSLPTLAERLRRTGYRTASYFTNPFAGPLTQLDRGFEQIRLMSGTDGEDLRPWFDEVGDERFFLYVHNVEPHDPYKARLDDLAEFDPKLGEAELTAVKNGFDYYRHLTRVDFRAKQPLGTTDNTEWQRAALAFLDEIQTPVGSMYDAQVKHADERIGSVINELKARGQWENTLFILVSDHGEEFGEHGGWLHDQSVYEELVHVPLMIRFPQDRWAGQRIEQIFPLVDLVPTLMRGIGREGFARDTGGTDRMGWIDASLGEPDAAATTGPIVTSMRTNQKKFFAPWKAARGDLNVAVRDGRWKAIWNVEPDTLELYDLEADSGETTDLNSQEPARAAALRQFAADWLKACRERSPVSSSDPNLPPGEMDQETIDRLKSLGYM